MNANQKNLLHLFIVLIFDLLAFTCILPLFPSLMDYYGRKAEQGDFYHTIVHQLKTFQHWIGVPVNYRYNSVLFGGFLGSMFCFLQFLSSPILGALSDLYGRKLLLLISAFGSLVSYGLWSQATTFNIFLLSRIIGGLSKASVSVASAIVADLLPAKSRGKGMVLIGAAFSVGFLIGPMIGAYFARQSRNVEAQSTDKFFTIPAYIAIGLSVFELFWIVKYLPETLPFEKRHVGRLSTIFQNVLLYVSPKSLFNFSSMTIISNQNTTKIKRIGLINFLFLLIYSGLEFTLAFFTHLYFEYSSMQQGQLYFAVGLLMVLIQGAYVRRLPAGQHWKSALAGLMATSLSFVLMGIVGYMPNKILFYISLAFYAFGSATVVTSLTTILSSFVSDSEQGTLLGTFRSLGALARALGPFIASAVFWILGPTLCYMIGGVTMLLPFYLARKLHIEEMIFVKND